MRARVTWAAVGLLVVASVAWGILLARDARAVADQLGQAQDRLSSARRLLADGETEAGREEIARARVHLEAAADRSDGVGWALGGSVPRWGNNVDVVRSAIALGEAGADLADAAGSELEGLLSQGASAIIGDTGGVDVDAMRELRDTIDALPVDAVVTARDDLARLDGGGLLGHVDRRRVRAIETADEALDTVARARDGLAAFSGFLGVDGPRRYLVAVQNPGELRGTGGLISYLAELQVQDGAIALGAAGITVSDAPDDLLSRPGEAGISSSDLDPVPRPDDFADRYDHVAGGAILQSVNADPDLPTVAPVLMDVYEARSGRQTDGVIVVDPVGLAQILEASGGPIEVPREYREEAPGLPPRLTAANLAETLTVTVYDAFGGSNPLRREFDEDITLEILGRLVSGGWDAVELTRAFGDATASRHLQLYSNDPDEQAGFERLGITGSMASVESTGGDVLAVTGINAAANKQDTLVAHRMSGELSLASVRDGAPATVDRRGTLTVELDNPVGPDEHDTYISGSQAPQATGSPRPEREETALNRTWFSVWAPRATQATEVRDDASGDEPQLFTSGAIHGHRVFDYFLETPSQTTNSFAIDLQGRVDLQRDGDELVYELVLWRQAKAIPDHWDLRIAPPAGWSVTTASVTGGGPPTGMGAGGDDGQRIAASVEDGVARAVGAVTQDATIEVRLARS